MKICVVGLGNIGFSRGVDLVRALEAAGNDVWVEDPLFTSDELSGAGFRSNDEGDQGKENQADRVVLERQRALELN